MKYTLLIFSGILALISCNRLSQTEIELRDNLNKVLQLDMFETVQQANNIMPFGEFRQQYQYLSVVYLQNGCQPCYPKFIEWQQKMDSIGVPDNYTVLFIIQGESYEEFMTEILDIGYVEDRFYTIMDTERRFMSKNKTIPMWIIDGSILIDPENKIKMVGAPWINEDMTKLFYETVNGEQ